MEKKYKILMSILFLTTVLFAAIATVFISKYYTQQNQTQNNAEYYTSIKFEGTENTIAPIETTEEKTFTLHELLVKYKQEYQIEFEYTVIGAKVKSVMGYTGFEEGHYWKITSKTNSTCNQNPSNECMRGVSELFLSELNVFTFTWTSLR